MLAEIGFITAFLAFLTAIYAIFASILGERIVQRESWVLSGRNAALLTSLWLVVSVGALWLGLMTQDYQIKYVWSVSNPDMPTFFRVTALWGSQSGSLLFWSALMGLFTAGTIFFNWRSHRRLMPYAIAVMMACLAFFLGLKLFIENPFNRWWIMPNLPANQQVVEAVFQPQGALAPSASQLAASAKGLNPLLRHFGMAIHPPMLYLGFVGFLIPFAFAISALASGDLSTNWLKVSRRWTLAAWLFLSLGLVLGGRWAYDVLGWGGYWGWDPVENAAFLPWLIGTAFLHSAMIQEKRGIFKTWNMFLIIGTFSAVIFGTFATRSGLVESVHSFARSGIGFPMFSFWFVLTVIAVSFIIWRQQRGELQDEHKLDGLLSREALFLLNNFVFVALFIAVFWGSFGAPIISELVMNTNITLGTDYFMQVTPPLFALMFVLMGVAPLTAWGATSLYRLGAALLIPLVLTLVSLAIIFATGTTMPLALFAYGIVLLSGWVVIVETVRGIQARQRAHHESLWQATSNLLMRNPRRYGGYLIHLGITVIGLGVIGSTLFQQETQRTLAVGESLTIGSYEMRYDALDGRQVSQDGRIMDIARLTVMRNGQEIARLSPRRDFFPNVEGMNSMTIAAAHSTLENDFYVLLVDWEGIAQSAATFKVYINPLINLVWWGSLILILGTLLTMYPRELVPARVRYESRLPLSAGAGASA